MIKKLQLITILYSLSLGAVPPNFIKLLESPEGNLVVPAKFGVIQNDILWLNPEAECGIWCESFENLIKEQYARKAPFVLAVTQSADQSGQSTLEMYEAHGLNKHLFGSDYLVPMILKTPIDLIDDRDALTRNVCHEVNYYKLTPGAKSFLYIGNHHELENFKELFLQSFPVYLEDDASIISLIGLNFMEGCSVEQNNARAKELFEQGAKLGKKSAIKYLADIYSSVDFQDQEKAIALYRQAAGLGNADAMLTLAEMYEQGEKVEKNEEKAHQLYIQAAYEKFKKGMKFIKKYGYGERPRELATEALYFDHAKAIFNFGTMCAHGEGVEQNYDRARELYELAANLGDSDAMLNLGVMYADGKGIERNNDRARELYELAANLDNSDAMFNLALMYADGKDVEQNYDRARELYEQAANLGDLYAMLNLGVMYENGQGVELDYGKAREFYEQAANLGNSRAMFNLGLMYADGKGVEQNYDRARELYEQAANLGDASAMVHLGNMYRHAEGVEQDYNKACVYYEQGVSLGDQHAKFNLALCYFTMFPITQNYEHITKAIAIFEELAALDYRGAIDILEKHDFDLLKHQINVLNNRRPTRYYDSDDDDFYD